MSVSTVLHLCVFLYVQYVVPNMKNIQNIIHQPMIYLWLPLPVFKELMMFIVNVLIS